jgi:hypothetical protein
MKYAIITALLAVSTTALAGCGMPVSDASEEALGGELIEEEVGHVAQGLGEAGCATAMYNALLDQPLLSGDVAHLYTKTSSDGSYDHSVQGCPKQFILEIRQTKGNELMPVAGWTNPPSTAATCQAARLDMSVYGSPTGMNDWTPPATARYIGVWTKVTIFDTSWYECHFKNDPSYFPNIDLRNVWLNEQFDRYRVVAKAYRTDTNVNYQVTAGVWSYY